RFGYGPAQSGFRGVGEGIRRRRRDRRAHRRVRAGVPARVARFEARADSRQDRSAVFDDEYVARWIARTGDGGAIVNTTRGPRLPGPRVLRPPDCATSAA